MRRGSRSERLVRLGAPEPAWVRGRPPPAWLPARLTRKDAVEMRARKTKDWCGGILAAAPSQDPHVLMRDYGAVISFAFLRRVQGKKPRPCTNYRPLVNTYAKRPRKFRNEDVRDVARWGEPEMAMYQDDTAGAFNHIATQPALQRYLVEDIGEPPPGAMGPHLPRFIVPLALNFGYCHSPELFDTVASEMDKGVRRANLLATRFVDDRLGGRRDTAQAVRDWRTSVRLHAYYGFRLAKDKGSSLWVSLGMSPVRRTVEHLGLIIATRPGTTQRQADRLASTPHCDGDFALQPEDLALKDSELQRAVTAQTARTNPLPGGASTASGTSAPRASWRDEQRQSLGEHDGLDGGEQQYVSQPDWAALSLVPSQVRLLHRGVTQQEAMAGYVPPRTRPLLPADTETLSNGLCIVPFRKAVHLERTAKDVLCRALADTRHVISNLLEHLVGFAVSLIAACREIQFRTRNLQKDLTMAGVYDRGRTRRPIRMRIRSRSVGELKWLCKFRLHQHSVTLWQEPVQAVGAADASGADVYAMRQSELLGRPVQTPLSRRHLYDKNPAWGGILMPLGGAQLTRAQQREVFRGVTGDGRFNPRNWPHVRVCSGIWNAWELKQMISFLELRALRKFQQVYRDELRNRAYLMWEDSSVTCRVVNKQYSKSPILQRELGLFLDEQAAINARCYCRYVNTSFNPSDRWSRLLYTSDWTFAPHVLRRIFDAFGEPTVDRFSQPHDHVVRRWNCPYPYPGVEGVDCWTQNWEGELNWCNPPWKLLPDVAQKLRAETGAAAIVITPSFETTSMPLLRSLATARLDLGPLSPGDIVPGPICRSGPEPLRNEKWELSAYYVPARTLPRSTLRPIIEQVVDYGPATTTEPSPRSLGKAPPSTPGPSAAPSSSSTSGRCASSPPSGNTTAKCSTGCSTTPPAATIRARSRMQRSSASLGGSDGGVVTTVRTTKTSTRGRQLSMGFSTRRTGRGLSTPTTFVFSRANTERSRWLARCHCCLPMHSSLLKRGSHCLRPVWRFSRKSGISLWDRQHGESASCSSVCCSSCGPTLSGDLSQATCACSVCLGDASSCAFRGSSNVTRSCSLHLTAGRSSCPTVTLAARSTRGAPSWSSASARIGPGAHCWRERRRRPGLLRLSRRGCGPLSAGGWRSPKASGSRLTVSASWARRRLQGPDTTRTGFGYGDCGRRQGKSSRISAMGTATRSIRTRSSRSASARSTCCSHGHRLAGRERLVMTDRTSGGPVYSSATESETACGNASTTLADSGLCAAVVSHHVNNSEHGYALPRTSNVMSCVRRGGDNTPCSRDDAARASRSSDTNFYFNMSAARTSTPSAFIHRSGHRPATAARHDAAVQALLGGQGWQFSESRLRLQIASHVSSTDFSVAYPTGSCTSPPVHRGSSSSSAPGDLPTHSVEPVTWHYRFFTPAESVSAFRRSGMEMEISISTCIDKAAASSESAAAATRSFGARTRGLGDRERTRGAGRLVRACSRGWLRLAADRFKFPCKLFHVKM